MYWNDECQYCRSNCNGGCNGAYKSAIEAAIKPYKDFQDTWEPLIRLIGNLSKDSSSNAERWYAIQTEYCKIINKERNKILDTLSPETRTKLKELFNV